MDLIRVTPRRRIWNAGVKAGPLIQDRRIKPEVWFDTLRTPMLPTRGNGGCLGFLETRHHLHPEWL